MLILHSYERHYERAGSGDIPGLVLLWRIVFFVPLNKEKILNLGGKNDKIYSYQTIEMEILNWQTIRRSNGMHKKTR